MIMHNETETRDLDLLVLPGGPDVDTARYLDKEEPVSLFTGKPCPFKERFDRVLLPKYITKQTPIFGICRGLQTLNVHFGGKLIQDLWEAGFSHSYNGEDRKKLVHNVKTNQAVLKQLGLDLPYSFKVNSIHHQVADHVNLAEEATILAQETCDKNKRNGVIEALTYFPNYPAHTVQWHPEEIQDEFSIGLIEHLLTLKD
jgi:putative glutamine amidotransferase